MVSNQPLEGKAKDASDVASSAQRFSVTIDDLDLQQVSSRPPFSRYLKDLWTRRFYILADARGKSFNSYQDMALGKIWVVLSPMLDAAMYGILFGLLLRTSRGIENFAGYLIIGVIFFGFMQAGLTGSTGTVKGARSMMAAFDFPRASIVISQSVKNFIKGLVSAAVAIFGALLFQWGNPPSALLFLVLPLYMLIHIFATGISFIVARVCAFVPDMAAIARVIGRGWFFVSGVFFSIERYATIPWVQDVMTANPAYQFLQAVRGVVMYGIAPSFGVWIYLLTWSMGLFCIGLVFFWRAEARYGTTH